MINLRKLCNPIKLSTLLLIGLTFVPNASAGKTWRNQTKTNSLSNLAELDDSDEVLSLIQSFAPVNIKTINPDEITQTIKNLFSFLHLNHCNEFTVFSKNQTAFNLSLSIIQDMVEQANIDNTYGFPICENHLDFIEGVNNFISVSFV